MAGFRFGSQFYQKVGGLIDFSSFSSQSRKYRFSTFARVSKITRRWHLFDPYQVANAERIFMSGDRH